MEQPDEQARRRVRITRYTTPGQLQKPYPYSSRRSSTYAPPSYLSTPADLQSMSQPPQSSSTSYYGSVGNQSQLYNQNFPSPSQHYSNYSHDSSSSRWQPSQHQSQHQPSPQMSSYAHYGGSSGYGSVLSHQQDLNLYQPSSSYAVSQGGFSNPGTVSQVSSQFGHPSSNYSYSPWSESQSQQYGGYGGLSSTPSSSYQNPFAPISLQSHATSSLTDEQARDWIQDFESKIKSAVQSFQSEKLKEAARQMLTLSHTLLSRQTLRVMNLDLDDIPDDLPRTNWRQLRKTLWANFNCAWLALLQKQKDVSKAELNGTSQHFWPDTTIELPQIEDIGNQLTRLCDGLEDSGLVDYEMGVWEDQIIELLEECRTLALRLKPDTGASAAET